MKIQRKVKGGDKPEWVSHENKRKYHCDICGKELFIAPDGKTVFCYCEDNK